MISSDDSLSTVNNDRPSAGRHSHDIGMGDRHPRAVAQAEDKGLRVPMPALSNVLRVHFELKLTDTYADFNMEGCPSNLRIQPPAL